MAAPVQHHRHQEGLPMSSTVADFVIQRLHDWGTRRIYGFPGDGINGFMGALGRAQDSEHAVRFIQARRPPSWPQPTRSGRASRACAWRSPAPAPFTSSTASTTLTKTTCPWWPSWGSRRAACRSTSSPGTWAGAFPTRSASRATARLRSRCCGRSWSARPAAPGAIKSKAGSRSGGASSKTERWMTPSRSTRSASSGRSARSSRRT